MPLLSENNSNSPKLIWMKRFEQRIKRNMPKTNAKQCKQMPTFLYKQELTENAI